MASYKHFYSLLFASAAAFSLCTSCVDDAYDLSDMDTTVGLNVNELTIPLNIESVTLDKILDIEDNSRIQRKVVNGKEIYAFVEEGEFNSSKIEIPSFTAKSQAITPIESTLEFQSIYSGANTRDASSRNTQPVCIFPVKTNSSTSFSESGTADPAIISISKVATRGSYNMHISVNDPNLTKVVGKVYFNNFKLLMPKFMEAEFSITYNGNKEDITSRYTSSTGILDISDMIIGVTDYDMVLTAEIASINFDNADDDLSFSNGEFSYKGDIQVLEGEIAIYAEDINTNATLDDIPQTLAYKCTPTISDIVVTSVTGEIRYDIEDIDIDPVKMNDLPDLLTQDGTNIVLANPQVYLQLNNPMWNYGIKAEAQIGLTAKRNKGENKEALSDLIEIVNENNLFCLAPNTNMPKEELYTGFESAEMIEFNGLSTILSGDGLPKEIDINVIKPEIPQQKVVDFKLEGQNLDPVRGKYIFFAPLALGEGSLVCYKDTLDEWFDETLEKLEISRVKINASVKSEIPANMEISIIPIGINGKPISGVTASKVNIEATDDPQSVEFVIVGSIKNLDGIIIDAKLTNSNGESISPVDRITLDDFKVTVSGKYIDEF